MGSKRIVIVVMSVMLILTAGVMPAAAADPAARQQPVGRPLPDRVDLQPAAERPLTLSERALSDAKVTEALAYAAALERSGIGLVGLDCATPNGAPGTSAARTSSCSVPSKILVAYPRQQAKNHYCGPAVGQVISNYAWSMSSTANKFSQTTIAGWMKTDALGQTTAPNMAVGLQKSTAGSPRHPSGFAWGVTDIRDTDGDGTTGDELHAFVVTAVTSWRMPLALAVKPHDPASEYHLKSWNNPVKSTGHWIAAIGWYSFWSGGQFSRIYYTDSSKNQGGGTGTYWDPTFTLNMLIQEHTKRIVW